LSDSEIALCIAVSERGCRNGQTRYEIREAKAPDTPTAAS